jgi:hypothetical protein
VQKEYPARLLFFPLAILEFDDKKSKLHQPYTKLHQCFTLVQNVVNTTVKHLAVVKRLENWFYDPDLARKALVRMVVLHELPFSLVDYDEFREFVSCFGIKGGF